jgi:chloride channel protein, CIC family
MFWSTDRFNPVSLRLRPRQLAVLEACVIGLVSGLAAVLLKQSVGFFGGLRLQGAQQFPVYLVLPFVGGLGGFLSGWLIERLAPEAAGSGIPQVKIALAGLPTVLNLRLAAVKLLSTVLGLSSGLSLGRQGPTVQVGAAIAGQLSRWFPTSPEHRRQLIAAGAAAGLAAGFNAPIAGVLFVVEELLQDVSGLTLGTAILASFIGAVVSRGLGGQTLVTPSAMNLNPNFELQYIPLLLLLGAMLGVLSVVFIRGIVLSIKLQQKLIRWGLSWRIGFAGLVSGAVIAILPATLRDNAALATVWTTGEFSWNLLALVFGIKFCLILLASGSNAPGGIFAPSLILGSSFGFLFSYIATSVQAWTNLPLGVAENAIAGSSDFASTFALAGMAAFFSAVTRGPITAIVMVFEITGEFDLVLPLMIASVTAYWVGESIASGSIYKYLLATRGIRLKDAVSSEAKLSNLKALDLMQRQVEVLTSELTLEAAKQAFAKSHHRGFPVVAAGELVGIITQSDLTRNPNVSDNPQTIAQLMTPHPVTVKPHDPLSHVLYLLNRYQISRLPVVDRHKLLGIITRADIIRAESEQLSGEAAEQQIQGESAYRVYQTREPETGVGRLLVPLAHPSTAEPLLKLATAIAAQKHYEIVCVNILLIPRHQSPAETPVTTVASQALLDRAKEVIRAQEQSWEVPVHREIWVAHDVAGVILKLIQESHIDLLLMGWMGMNVAPGFIFSNVVDTIIRQAACTVMLVKFPIKPGMRLSLQGPLEQFNLTLPIAFDRWLIPTAGGPNSAQAMRLVGPLLALSQTPEVYLCHVSPTDTPEAVTTLAQASEGLAQRITASIKTIQVVQESIAGAIVDLAARRNCDVILLGATRMGLLQQVVQGNIPEEIARRSDCTVILVRGVMS